jgi:hypothetical protein
MKKTNSIVFLIVIVTLNYAGTNAKAKVPGGFNLATIQRTTEEIEGSFIPPNGDFNLFKKQVTAFQHMGLVAIPVTEKLVKKYVSTFSGPDKDSVFVLYSNVFYSQVNRFNDSFETTYKNMLERIDRKIHDPEITDFNKSLDRCGLSLMRTEGIYYVDEKYNYFYKLFNGKVSRAMNEYLKIRKKELKEGFSNDAELVISFNQLYQRVLTWEKFNNSYPDFVIRDDTQNHYTTYMSTLVTGMDNSPTFDYDTGILYPELNTLYLKITARQDSLKSTKTIKDYYELLKISGFKMPADLDSFLIRHELYSMKGVQPDTR